MLLSLVHAQVGSAINCITSGGVTDGTFTTWVEMRFKRTMFLPLNSLVGWAGKGVMKIGLDHLTYNNNFNPNPSQVPKYSHGRFCGDAGKSAKISHTFKPIRPFKWVTNFYCDITSADTKCLAQLFQSLFWLLLSWATGNDCFILAESFQTTSDAIAQICISMGYCMLCNDTWAFS